MGIEIERKFLLANDQWRCGIRKSTKLRQGYLTQSEQASIRIRTDAEIGWLNVKSAVLGPHRQEFEYEIPLQDAEQMLDTLAKKPLIEKTRHIVDFGSHTWEIDEFDGDNSGLIVAEIELSEVDEIFEPPDWIGVEVTMDPRYYNTNLQKKPYKSW